MKCRYCKAEMTFGDWIGWGGNCYPCSKNKRERLDEEQEKRSLKYWEKRSLKA